MTYNIIKVGGSEEGIVDMCAQETPPSINYPAGDRMIRDRMIHTLTIYPKLSMSMLQVGIGTALPPSVWHPILASLIESGIVRKTTTFHKTPSQRDQEYTILELTKAGKGRVENETVDGTATNVHGKRGSESEGESGSGDASPP